ncbi:hypothetical protein P872_10805 [Rhodonellum psychrophilum GCM71 = DSM 17998]|uniref:Uncharacterized protein n=1 Tax=Rhodonellum psychrophilum GCM71 = DSM 17998 TaxID=1123057 RepID=U5BUQ7_9BACT|nr:hypothetical protein P872_10805 [Rhodonellum psychrophilum GCM71 = DSM 17998]
MIFQERRSFIFKVRNKTYPEDYSKIDSGYCSCFVFERMNN